jgi:hypothetical protein
MRIDRRLFAATLLGCLAATTAPATSPAVATFEDKKAGVRLTYPADWQPVKGSKSLVDVEIPGDKGFSELSIDIPKLPWHPPGMLPMSQIESGYISDLKKNEIHDAKEIESVALKVSDCTAARRVKSSGHENGKEMIDVGILIVHADRVYILSCDGDDAGYPTARAALDASLASIEWIK